MFTISAKGIYGLTALTELAARYRHGTMQIRDIAEMHNIPQHYLEQILVVLKKGGLVESQRGSQGGYRLARSPSAIVVIDAMTLLEGKLEIVSDPRKQKHLDFFWSGLDRAIRDHLEVTLEDLLLARQQRDHQFVYTI
ncbi:MAG TPA: Rrf2 family transcriptional regulator [Spirochaetia bacterium]|nr:Rrf2 family transcriptional regulator [Spirochaetia bacterium]